MLSVIMLSVIMLSVIMLSVIMLNVILLSVIILSVVMLNVVTPCNGPNKLKCYITLGYIGMPRTSTIANGAYL
jgi:hypothetical protein